MKRWLGIALAASIALNVGVIAAAAYQAWRAGGMLQASYFGMPHERLPDYLGLDAAQRTKWHALEERFLTELADDAREIRVHRERMIGMIFGERPDPAAIEAERARIFALQERQQRRVVSQLLAEREMLSAAQRAKLADQLVRQAPPGAQRP